MFFDLIVSVFILFLFNNIQCILYCTLYIVLLMFHSVDFDDNLFLSIYQLVIEAFVILYLLRTNL